MYKAINIDKIHGRRSYRPGKRILDVERFIASGEIACEIILEPGEKPSYVCSTFQQTIRRRQYYRDAVEAFMRGGRVFLVRKNLQRENSANADS